MGIVGLDGAKGIRIIVKQEQGHSGKRGYGKTREVGDERETSCSWRGVTYDVTGRKCEEEVSCCW